MTDRYEKIRKALAMGPTPGPWVVRYDYVVQARSYEDGRLVPVAQPYGVNCDGTDLFANANLIAACDPDTIRALLDEREALRAEVDALRLNAASVQPELVAVALAACDAVDDLIEKWYATRESGCLPNQVVRARGASKLLRAIAKATGEQP